MKEAQVSTDLFGRGIDIERVNIVINYDMPDESIQAALLVLTKIGPIRANSWIHGLMVKSAETAVWKKGKLSYKSI